MSHYVRARHYSYVTGNWSTVDRWLTLLLGYSYATGRSTKMIDYSGQFPIGEGGYIDGGKGTIGGIPIGGGLKLDNCFHADMPIPVTPLPWLRDISIGLDFCRTVYDTSCCKPPATAQECIDMKLKFGAKAKLPIDYNISKLPDDVRALSNILMSMVSMINIIGLAPIPVRGCPEKGYSFEFKVCLKGCIGIASAEACIGYPSGFTLDVKYGFCGMPRAQVQGQVGLKDCH